MCILEKWKLRKKIKKSYGVYSESLEKSKAAIENVLFSDGTAPLYFSRRKFESFLDTFSITPEKGRIVEDSQSNLNCITKKDQIGIKNLLNSGIEAISSDSQNKKITKNYQEDTEIRTIKDNIKDIISKGDSILDARKNNFFYANFPVFHGHLTELTTRVTDVYLWYGEYRNIKLYLCGNIKNVSSIDIDKEKFPCTEWNPSTINGKKEIFNYFINEQGINEIKDDDDTIFKIFEANIYQSVMNRTDAKSYYQWHEMIVYCTNIREEENGIKEIIGIPLLVIPSKTFGYDWYNLKYEHVYDENIKPRNGINNKDDFIELENEKFRITNLIDIKDAFFEYENGKFTGRFLMKEKTLYNPYFPFENEFSYAVDIIDVNSAYKYRYSIKKTENIPKETKVKNSCDIIGLCIDKNLGSPPNSVGDSTKFVWIKNKIR